MKFRPRMTKCFVNETPVLNPIISHRLSKASFVPSFFQSERVRQIKKVSLGWFRDAAFCWFFLMGFDCPGQGSILLSVLKEQCFTDLRLIFHPNVCFLYSKTYSLPLRWNKMMAGALPSGSRRATHQSLWEAYGAFMQLYS